MLESQLIQDHHDCNPTTPKNRPAALPPQMYRSLGFHLNRSSFPTPSQSGSVTVVQLGGSPTLKTPSTARPPKRTYLNVSLVCEPWDVTKIRSPLRNLQLLPYTPLRPLHLQLTPTSIKTWVLQQVMLAEMKMGMKLQGMMIGYHC